MKIENLEGPKMNSVILKSIKTKFETRNLRDQKSGGEIYGTAFKTFILKRKHI